MLDFTLTFGAHYNFLGSLTLTITIVSLLLGFTWAGDKFEWASFQIIGLFSLTLISLLAFIFIELKVKSPVLPLYLFKNSVFTVSNIAGMLMGMGMFGTIMYVPFYVQGVQGESATVSGLVEMVMTIAMVSSSILVGNLITKTGKYKIFALLGLIIMAIGLILNSTLQVESSLTRLILQLIVVGIGLGVNMPVFNITVQNAVSHKYLGVATSAMQTFRQIGGTVGVALLGSVMGNKMANELSSTTQVENAPTPPPEMAETMSQLQNPQVLMDSEKLESIQSELPAEMAPFFEQFIQVLKEALNTSLTTVFTVSAGIIGLAFIVTLFLKEIPLRTTNNDEEENQEVEVERS